MNINMTPIPKLDGVLKILASQYPVIKEYSLSNFYTYENELGLIAAELFFIMEKLEEDGYVKIRHTPETSETPGLTTAIPYYSITFKGAFFILNKNGYTGEIFRDTAESTRLDKIDAELRANRNWTLWLTIVLTVGTLIQSLYCLVSLYWEHRWFHF